MPSKSEKQKRFMAMIANKKGAAAEKGVPKKVAKEFVAADKKKAAKKKPKPKAKAKK
jgi:hypothetical protein